MTRLATPALTATGGAASDEAANIKSNTGTGNAQNEYGCTAGTHSGVARISPAAED